MPVRSLQGLVRRRTSDSEQMQSLFDGTCNKQEFPASGFEHAFCGAVIEEAEEFVVEAINVE